MPLYRVMKTIAGLLSISIIVINLYFVVVYIQELPHKAYIYVPISLVVVAYLLFVAYLVSAACRTWLLLLL